ncbi:hypothetical protein H261_12844 [Paramagnetospirillum caucaseum]|uniref:Uncharacterized protein n=1 Tax=Paramagnetospirillum caucaseum TaxID=1244869 RepID=M2Y922_9PROT|nr:hypothetical protein [Paramagnetospirillum caucaseum]EME69541.1 hypothetical protein H261_12844 [Paramagnetospirillum caucaseum]
MRKLLLILPLLIASPGWAAESWGLPGEEAASFDGKVVDVQCVLTKDCPKDCGAGRRQLGLLKKDGALILAMKNADPFAGATRDLLPFCGKSITVDGLFTSNEGVRAFALQRVKPPGGEWIAANGFVRDWAKAHKLKPDSPQAEEWFRHDQTVAGRIKAEGKLGLGPGQ